MRTQICVPDTAVRCVSDAVFMASAISSGSRWSSPRAIPGMRPRACPGREEVASWRERRRKRVHAAQPPGRSTRRRVLAWKTPTDGGVASSVFGVFPRASTTSSRVRLSSSFPRMHRKVGRGTPRAPSTRVAFPLPLRTSIVPLTHQRCLLPCPRTRGSSRRRIRASTVPSLARLSPVWVRVRRRGSRSHCSLWSHACIHDRHPRAMLTLTVRHTARTSTRLS